MPARILAILVLTIAFLASACSVNVKKDGEGEEKNVDIKTPFAEIHVDKGADVRDTGLPVYAGARLKPKGDHGEDKSANVNLSAFGYGLKVVAVEYESDDPPSKLVSFYRDALKKYGNVLECHTSHRGSYDVDRHDKSDQLKCEGDNSGKTIELKAGTRSNQHIVAIEPRDKGSKFALVYVRTHDKDDTI